MNNRAVPKAAVSFGRRSEPHTITITKGNNVRNFTVRPALFAGVCGVVGVFMLGYLGATAYLVLRDDLIGTSLARQARLQQSYEGRIAALRSKLDLVTSQQLLEQQVVETRVKELIERQKILGSRSSMFGSVLQKAASNGLAPANIAVPTLRPNENAPITTGALKKPKNLVLGSLTTGKNPFRGSFGRIDGEKSPYAGVAATYASLGEQDRVFASVENSLLDVETRQLSTLKILRSNAVKKTRKIASILKKIGVPLPSSMPKNIGGPFVELDDYSQFEDQITALDVALGDLENARLFAANLPIGNPAIGRSTSSKFGPRIDPFKRRTGMHTGVDLRAPKGFPVRATGVGRVVKAGPNGGYGLFVEIVHGNGLVTRYAHMSKVRVKVGQRVVAGTLVGNVGSTGRSTGPHLHYEVRYRGKPQNPARYVRAGAKLKSLL